MTRFIAFLRAVNVGGRTVKMDQLRKLFESLGFSNVETFIASGNVIFESGVKDAKRLEKKIGDALRRSLGYEVTTFVRSASELRAVVDYPAFDGSGQTGGDRLYVAFLPSPLADAVHQKLMTFRSEIDDIHVHGREVYWLCRKKMSESEFSGALLERTIRMPATIRNITTVKKLAARYQDDPSS